MRPAVRNALEQVLPPIVVRGLRTFTDKPGGWDVKASLPTGVVFHNGRSLRLRDAVADHEVVRQIFADRDYDFRAFRQARASMAAYDAMPAPLVLDCGANIGASALWFAETFPRARVVAVEPDPGNLALLRDNAVERVEVIAGAVAGRPGEVALDDPGGGGWAMRTRPGQGVRAWSIDELVAGRGDPFLLKIDIEGFEADLFEHPAAALDAFPLIVLELHDWMLPGSASSRPFLAWHAQRRRDFCFRGENVFSFRID